MRGIHINNYIDNRIMMPGKKVNNQVTAVVQSHKPKPIIINHLLKDKQESLQYIREDKAIKNQNTSQKKRKRRTKTVIVNNPVKVQEESKHRIKLCLNQMRKNKSNKKQSASSSPSRESDNIHMVETQRKLNPVYQNGNVHNPSGLGKRSKSAIIKRTKQMKSQEKERLPVDTTSKSAQKINNLSKKQHKNITSSKKNLKVKNQQKSKNKQKTTQRERKSKKGQQIKKIPSEINLSLNRKIKKIPVSGSSATTARKTTGPQSKSHIVSSTVSKPNSARGYKKIKGSEIKAEINKKLFKNQGIQGQLYSHKRNVITDEQQYIKMIQMNKDSQNSSMKKVVKQLQQALNTVGSRKKMQKQLQNLLQRIQAMGSQEGSSDESNNIYNETHHEFNIGLARNKLQQQDEEQFNQPGDFDTIVNKQLQSQEQVLYKEGQTPEIDKQIQDQQLEIVEDDNQQIFQNQYPESTVKSDQISGDMRLRLTGQNYLQKIELIQFNPDEDISRSFGQCYQAKKQDKFEVQTNLKSYPIQINSTTNNNNQQKLTDKYQLREYNDNPMLNRRNNQQLDVINMSQYDSIKSHQDEKQAEISQLKKFQEQSNLMMQKIKKIQGKQNLQINIEPQPKLDPEVQINPISDKMTKNQSGQSQKTPTNAEVYGFQRYPNVTTTEQLKSPKFSSQNISQIISLKQKVCLNHHDKLSQLVNVLFQKNVVSPRTHQFQINIIDIKYKEQNQKMDDYRKHAEQLSKILSQIKKQKEQIHGIQQLIRDQKWNQALQMVKIQKQQTSQKQIKNQYDMNTHRSLPRSSGAAKYSDKSLSEQQENLYYYDGEQSDQNSLTNSFKMNFSGSQGDGFKLIKINEQNSSKSKIRDEESHYISSSYQQNQGSKEQLLIVPNISEQTVIKIDENQQIDSEIRRQRGFQSNLFFIKQYCIALCQFVRDYHKGQFKKSISKSIKYDINKLLEAYRTKKDRTASTKLNSLYEDLTYHDCQKKASSPPISQFIFDQFNKNYERIKYFGKQQTQDAALQGIFLRSIFNALNQSISIQRPGSIHGEPLPWSHTAKHLKNYKNKMVDHDDYDKENSQSEDMIFGIAIARIIQWGSCLCGFIPDTIQLQNTEIDEQYINHIRETRMALLLQRMLSQQQAEMSQMVLQQTEVALCLSHLIADELIKQTAQQMKTIMKRRVLRDVDY